LKQKVDLNLLRLLMMLTYLNITKNGRNDLKTIWIPKLIFIFTLLGRHVKTRVVVDPRCVFRCTLLPL
jgi:hypothetical protein